MTGQDLKNSILQLAIQGKLVPQDANDEPASVLLERIKAEKQKLINEKKIKKEKPLPEITDEEKPFEIPESWEWVRLGDYCERITDYVASGSFASLRQNVPVLKGSGYAIMVKTADFSNNFSVNLTYTTKEGYDFLSNSNLFGGELIITNIGATLGKVSIVPYLDQKMTLAPNSVMVRMLDDEHRDYLKMFLSSSIGYREMLDISSGTAMKKFNKTDLKTILIPLPPLAEQHRIVAKIEELMPLVEEYDKAQKELDALNAKLPEALKKSILQEAIQGKLVPQDPNDEPASVLLQRIRKEKEQLVKDGKLKKKDLVTTPISDEEKPFEIPESWEWCRMGDVLSFINGRAYKKEELLDSGMTKVLRVGNFFTNDKWYYSDLELPDEKYCYKGDLLYAWSASFGPRIWEGEKSIFHYHIWNVKYNKKELYREYLYYFLLNDVNQIKKSTTGSTMIHVSMENMMPRLIPIPPLAEQHRIVSKIEDLFAQIEPLAKALSTPM